MTTKQTATEIRKLLRYAGATHRVQIAWLAKHLQVPVAEITSALDQVETPKFRVMRFPGSAASVAMA